MKQPSGSKPFPTLLVFVAAAAAMAIGVWENIEASPTEVVEQTSAFVRSGGVTADADPSVPDASQALSHARASSVPDVAANSL